MTKLDVKKVASREDRKMPIFKELDEVAERIRIRAYNLFASRGFSQGHELEDWLTAQREICWPEAELVESKDAFSVKVALAGFDPANITVTATPRELIIKAARKDERAETEDRGGATIHWSEFRSNDVYRQIELPADADVARTTAEFDQGMLLINAPRMKGKPPSGKSSKIKISPAT